MDSNATRRTCIGLGAGPHVPLAFTSMIQMNTKHLGHARWFIPMEVVILEVVTLEVVILEVVILEVVLVAEGGLVLLKVPTFGIAMD